MSSIFIQSELNSMYFSLMKHLFSLKLNRISPHAICLVFQSWKGQFPQFLGNYFQNCELASIQALIFLLEATSIHSPFLKYLLLSYAPNMSL